MSKKRCFANGPGEQGSSVVEVILFTVPLCLLSMVITSKMAATSTGLVQTQWRSSLAAQQGGTTACGGTSQLAAPWQSQSATNTAIQIHNQLQSSGAVTGASSVPGSVQDVTNAQLHAQANLSTRNVGDYASLLARITQVGTLVSSLGTGLSGLVTAIESQQGAFPVDILTQSGLSQTNFSTNSASMAPPAYYFKPLADQVVPDPANAQLARQAAFICNVPLVGSTGYGGPGNKQSRLDSIRLQLIGWTVNEAERFY